MFFGFADFWHRVAQQNIEKPKTQHLDATIEHWNYLLTIKSYIYEKYIGNVYGVIIVCQNVYIYYVYKSRHKGKIGWI